MAQGFRERPRRRKSWAATLACVSFSLGCGETSSVVTAHTIDASGGADARSAGATGGTFDAGHSPGAGASGGHVAGRGGVGGSGGGVASGGAIGDGGAVGSGGSGGLATFAGPCVDTTECNGLNGFGSQAWHCVCSGNGWRCATYDAPLDPSASLPAGDPVDGAACNPTFNGYACSLPDHCGSLCICDYFSRKWVCKTLVDTDAGVTAVDGLPAGPDGPVCAWHPCPSDQSPCSGNRCFAVECLVPTVCGVPTPTNWFAGNHCTHER